MRVYYVDDIPPYPYTVDDDIFISPEGVTLCFDGDHGCTLTWDQASLLAATMDRELTRRGDAEPLGRRLNAAERGGRLAHALERARMAEEALAAERRVHAGTSELLEIALAVGAAHAAKARRTGTAPSTLTCARCYCPPHRGPCATGTGRVDVADGAGGVMPTGVRS